MDNVRPVKAGVADGPNGASTSIDGEAMKKIVFPLVLAYAACGCLIVAAAGDAGGKGRIETFSDLDGKRIGILTGTLFEYLVNRTLDHTQLFYYEKLDDMLRDLQNGELDGIVDDEPALRYVASRDPRYRVIGEQLETYEYALLFNKNCGDLAEKFDAELASMVESGEIARLVAKWMAGDGAATADFKRYSGSRLVRLAVFTESPPFVYRDKQNNIVGIDVEIVETICRRLGYRLEVSHTGFDGLFDALEENRADVAAASLTVMEERKPFGIYSVPYYSGAACAMVRAE